MPGEKKSTVVLVARHAGVSVASVSRVLNGLPASDTISERVRSAAQELGYVPDATARSLKAGKTEQIAFAVADVGNPVYVTMMHAVSRVIADAGYRLVMSSTGNDPEEQIGLLSSLNRGYADGLVLIPLRVTDSLVAQLESSRLPIVVIGSLPDRVQLDNVRADSAQGVEMAVEHLADQRRSRVAFLNGPLDTVPGTARLSGFVRGMTRHGLTMTDDMQVEAADFTYKAGLVAAARLLDQAAPDAIVCANDLLAVAAMKVITSRGMNVPADIALVGMDDTDIAELANPSITSVNLRSAKRAKTAAKLLIARLRDPAIPPRKVVLEPKLTIRESSLTTSSSTASPHGA